MTGYIDFVETSSNPLALIETPRNHWIHTSIQRENKHDMDTFRRYSKYFETSSIYIGRVCLSVSSLDKIDFSGEETFLAYHRPSVRKLEIYKLKIAESIDLAFSMDLSSAGPVDISLIHSFALIHEIDMKVRSIHLSFYI